ncbi:hypothetical protein [Enterobacter ludwigii]|uniref:hypothetical protein n=1 Tax=Enterobacter ludwigii TaxID=299767 RepID=UPI0040687EF9
MDKAQPNEVWFRFFQLRENFIYALRFILFQLVAAFDQVLPERFIRGRFGYRKLLYYKDFPGMSKPVFMVSVCSSVKIKGRDCGTINGHDESSSIRALMKDAREVLVR